MNMINHYQTLEISPSASLPEIRRSYRRLAMKYHPDKNPENEYAETRFKEIQHAYAIIGSPDKRKEYDYQYWLNTGARPAGNFIPVTSFTILKESIRLRQYVLSANVFSIDQDALHFHISALLSPKNLETLSGEENEKIKVQIIKELLEAGRLLKFGFMEKVMAQLVSLAHHDPETLELIEKYFLRRKKMHRADKLMPVAVLLLVALLCWLIYLYGS